MRWCSTVVVYARLAACGWPSAASAQERIILNQCSPTLALLALAAAAFVGAAFLTGDFLAEAFALVAADAPVAAWT